MHVTHNKRVKNYLDQACTAYPDLVWNIRTANWYFTDVGQSFNTRSILPITIPPYSCTFFLHISWFMSGPPKYLRLSKNKRIVFIASLRYMPWCFNPCNIEATDMIIN